MIYIYMIMWSYIFQKLAKDMILFLIMSSSALSIDFCSLQHCWVQWNAGWAQNLWQSWEDVALRHLRPYVSLSPHLGKTWENRAPTIRLRSFYEWTYKPTASKANIRKNTQKKQTTSTESLRSPTLRRAWNPRERSPDRHTGFILCLICCTVNQPIIQHLILYLKQIMKKSIQLFFCFHWLLFTDFQHWKHIWSHHLIYLVATHRHYRERSYDEILVTEKLNAAVRWVVVGRWTSWQICAKNLTLWLL